MVKKYFIQSKIGMIQAKNLGLNPRTGKRKIFCPCGCGDLLMIQSGWVIETDMPRKKLDATGLIVSAMPKE